MFGGERAIMKKRILELPKELIGQPVEDCDSCLFGQWGGRDGDTFYCIIGGDVDENHRNHIPEDCPLPEQKPTEVVYPSEQVFNKALDESMERNKDVLKALSNNPRLFTLICIEHPDAPLESNGLNYECSVCKRSDTIVSTYK